MKIKHYATIAAALLFLAISVPGQVAEGSVINGGVLNSRALKLPRPEFPKELVGTGLSGSVAIQVTIDENGNVIEAGELLTDQGNGVVIVTRTNADPIYGDPTHPLFVEAAREAALQAKFAPTRLSGKPVRVQGVIVYIFSARESKDSEAPGTDSLTRDNVLNSKALSLPKPVYPPAALAVGAQGAVIVRVLIDENGNVTKAEAVSGHPLLRSAGIGAARNASFRPTNVDGEPVRVVGILVYHFVSKDGAN